jgi:hypothetical protein
VFRSARKRTTGLSELHVECLIAAPATCGIGGSLVPDAGFVAAQPIPAPASEQVQRTITITVHGDCVSLRRRESRLRSCIDSKAVNRLDDDRNDGQSQRGDDASRGLRSGVVACGRDCGIWGVMAFRQPGIHAGRGAAALHARCPAALFLGNTRRRADHRLHAPATRQFERRMPQRLRQTRAVRVGRQIATGTPNRSRPANGRRSQNVKRPM